MIINNPNKVFTPITITLDELWEVRRFKTILEQAEKRIREADYVYGEEDLIAMIGKLAEALE